MSWLPVFCTPVCGDSSTNTVDSFPIPIEGDPLLFGSPQIVYAAKPFLNASTAGSACQHHYSRWFLGWRTLS